MGLFDNFLVNITKKLCDLIKEPKEKDLSLFQDIHEVIIKHQGSCPIPEHQNTTSCSHAQTLHPIISFPVINSPTASSSVMSLSACSALQPPCIKRKEVSQEILAMLPPIQDVNEINHTIIPSGNEYDSGSSVHSQKVVTKVSMA